MARSKAINAGVALVDTRDVNGVVCGPRSLVAELSGGAMGESDVPRGVVLARQRRGARAWFDCRQVETCSRSSRFRPFVWIDQQSLGMGGSVERTVVSN